MISWIQRYFQKHFKVVVLLILAAMAVPLVVIFTPSSGIGQGDRRVLTREFFGYNLGSPEDQARLFGDANLSATLHLGFAGIGGDQLQQYALQRAAAIHVADQLHIPASTKAEVADYIKNLRAFTGPDGAFDAQRYATFRDSLKTGGARVTEGDVSRVLSADVRANKVRQLLAGPGYVLDEDVKTQLARAGTTWTLGVAKIDYAAFNPTVSPSTEELAKFFGDNSFRYEIPPRVQVAAVVYPADEHLAGVTVTEEELQAVFERSPGRFQKPGAEAGTTQPAQAGDFLLVRDQVASAVKLAKARQLATKQAADLSLALYESRLKNDPAVLEPFLRAHGVQATPLQPFTREAGPAEYGNNPELAEAAFKLGEARFFSDALPVENGAVVLLWQDTIPARTPLLTEVQDVVKADYVENEKRKRFIELGRKLQDTIKTRLQAGDAFAPAVNAAAAAHGAKADVSTLAPFTLAEPPEDVDYAIFGALERLEKGGLSDMMMSQDHGLFVHATDKQPPDLTAANPAYVDTRNQLAAMTGQLGAGAYLDELVEAELKKSEPDLN